MQCVQTNAALAGVGGADRVAFGADQGEMFAPAACNQCHQLDRYYRRLRDAEQSTLILCRTRKLAGHTGSAGATPPTYPPVAFSGFRSPN